MLGSGRRAGHSATTDGPGRLSLELSLARWCPVGQPGEGLEEAGAWEAWGSRDCL